MDCLSQVLPTVSVLSDDRGELREIVTDRYGADNPFIDHCCYCVVTEQEIQFFCYGISFCAGAESPASPAVATDAPVSHTNTSLDWLFDTPPSPPNKAVKIPPLVALNLFS